MTAASSTCRRAATPEGPGSRRALALLLAGAVAVGFAPSPRQDGGSPATALPYELAFARLRPGVDGGPVSSPDGSVVAATFRRPGAVATGDARFLPDGTPAPAAGSRLFLIRDGAATDVCPAEADCWRPAWSPDGTQLAFYANAGGVPAVWVYAPATGSRPVAGVRVKTVLYGGDEPRWSADGRSLLVPAAPSSAGEPAPAPAREAAVRVTVYTSPPRPIAAATAPEDVDERLRREGAADLVSVDVATGDVKVLVPSTDPHSPSVLDVSASGRWLSFFSVPRSDPEALWGAKHDIAVCRVDACNPAVVAADLDVPDDAYRDGVRWHPRADALAWVRDGALHYLDLESGGAGEQRRLAADLGTILDRPLTFSPDGTALIVGFAPRAGRNPYDVAAGALAIVPLDGGEVRRLPLGEGLWLRELVGGARRSAWRTGEGTLLALMDDRASGETVGVEIDPGTGHVGELVRARASWSAPVAAGESLVAVYEDLETPPDLYALDSRLRPIRRLSRLEPALDAVVAAHASALQVTVPVPGGEPVTVQPVLLSATATPRAAPTVVLLYPGADLGRHRSYFGGGEPITVPTPIFVSRDYNVLLADVPMREFGAAADPAAEITAGLLPQVEAAVAAGWADPERLALVGQSYGGYSTAAVLTRTERFRAAVAISGTYDLMGIWGQMDADGRNRWIPWLEQGQGRMGAPPWEAPERYLENSPYQRANRIRTPLLLLHGDRDAAHADAGKLFSALRRLGRRAELASYAGEGHAVSEWSLPNAVDAARRILAFLDEHLGDGAASTSRR